MSGAFSKLCAVALMSGMCALLLLSGQASAQDGVAIAPATVLAERALQPDASESDIRVQLTPQEEARILSRMSGVVTGVSLRDGDTVKKGDVIVTFSCDEREQRASQALARKKKQDELAASASRLAELGTGSALDSAVRQAEKAEADANYDLSRTEASYCVISAPFDGRISLLEVKLHQTVRENDLIVEIIQDTTLKAEMIVPSQWLSWLKVGLLFDVYVDETGNRYPAKITHIGGRVDPVSQTIKIYAVLSERPAELLAGMSGAATLAPPSSVEP